MEQESDVHDIGWDIYIFPYTILPPVAFRVSSQDLKCKIKKCRALSVKVTIVFSFASHYVSVYAIRSVPLTAVMGKSNAIDIAGENAARCRLK